MDRLLLRNPADYKSGFWTSYIVDDVLYFSSSTESKNISMVTNKGSKGLLEISLEHHPSIQPLVKFGIDVWSYNRPFLLVRHTVTNVSGTEVKDMKLYSFMDYDIGGPRSYKDDIGRYDPETAQMVAYDDNALFVSMESKPKPDLWELASPTKLRVSEDKRDLIGNFELGPQDIATGLQWNLGDLMDGESKSVKLVIASAIDSERVKEALIDGWKVFDKKIR